VSGPTRATLIQPREMGGPDLAVVELAVCLDVSAVELRDASGSSIVSPDRPNEQTMLVLVEKSPETETGWAVSKIEGREGEPLCL
jgi:hypothetical protein